MTDKAEANKAVVFVELPLLLPFSLTKYTAIFVEVKGCFRIFNNQLGGLNSWIILNKNSKRFCVLNAVIIAGLSWM